MSDEPTEPLVPGMFLQGRGEDCPQLPAQLWALLVQEETVDKAITSFLTACFALDSPDLFEANIK